MMDDIVVDTNVLVHSSNPQEAMCVAARQLIQRIGDSTVILCLDEGFDTDPAKNRSHIGYEYIQHVRHGSFAFGFILKLVSEQRIRALSRKVDTRSKRRICQSIRKPADRTFVFVTLNSLERTLVSHDFEDFSVNKRAYLEGELGIRIVTAPEVLPNLT
jgi:hypothetical protein